jgi:hypothetical protein
VVRQLPDRYRVAGYDPLIPSGQKPFTPVRKIEATPYRALAELISGELGNPGKKPAFEDEDDDEGRQTI